MHPILFEIGGITVYSYGVAKILSYMAAGALVLLTARTLGQPVNDAVQSGVGLIAGWLIGGRLGFVLFNRDHAWTLTQLLSPGGRFINTTAVLGAVLGAMLIARRQHRSMGTSLDLVTPSVVGGWAIGNLGCFLAGCCWGARTDVPWGVAFSAELTPLELKGVPVHPVQLYALGWELGVLALLFLLPRAAPGVLFLRGVAALFTMKLLFMLTGVAERGVAMPFVYLLLLAIAGILLVMLRHKAPADRGT